MNAQKNIKGEKSAKTGKELEKQYKELHDKYLRALAEMQNIKRREEEARREFVKFANTSLILDLLPMLDNLDRAKRFMGGEDKKNEKIKGLLNILEILEGVLVKQGLSEIKTIGEKLDPSMHEAVMQGNGKKDTIIEELEKGYTLNGKIIRPAKVKVGNGHTDYKLHDKKEKKS